MSSNLYVSFTKTGELAPQFASFNNELFDLRGTNCFIARKPLTDEQLLVQYSDSPIEKGRFSSIHKGTLIPAKVDVVVKKIMDVDNVSFIYSEIEILQKLASQFALELKTPFAKMIGFSDSSIVSEQIGPSLKNHLSSNSFSLDKTILVAHQLIHALECLHAAGVAHQNISIDTICESRWDPNEIKLINFEDAISEDGDPEAFSDGKRLDIAAIPVVVWNLLTCIIQPKDFILSTHNQWSILYPQIVVKLGFGLINSFYDFWMQCEHPTDSGATLQTLKHHPFLTGYVVCKPTNHGLGQEILVHKTERLLSATNGLSVYQAEIVPAGYPVAIKIATDPVYKSALRAESQALKILNNSYSCGPFNQLIGELIETNQCIILEESSESIAKNIPNSGLNFSDSLVIMRPLINIVESMHAVGVAHGNLCIESLYFNDGRTKLRDFESSVIEALSIKSNFEKARLSDLAGICKIFSKLLLNSGINSPELLKSKLSLAILPLWDDFIEKFTAPKNFHLIADIKNHPLFTYRLPQPYKFLIK